jgi:small subunit ribosomal protein S3Ae
VHAPKFLGEGVIGDTPAIDAGMVKDRVVESNLFELTSDASKFHMKLFFKVDSVNGSEAYTKFFGQECTRDFISRIVQKRTGVVETNDILQLADGKMRVKAIAICNRPTHSNIDTKIRKRVSEMLSAEKPSIEKFVLDFTSGKTQNAIRNEITKIYPIRFFEIRKSEVLE